MGATEAFELSPPTTDDLHAAQKAWRDGRLAHELRAGETWWRVVRAPTPLQALEYAEVCYGSDTNNRFSPLYRDGAIAPAAYAGGTDTTAIWEVVLRGIRHDGIRRVPQREVRDRYLVEVRTSRPLRLLNLRRPQSANLVVSGKRPPDLTAAWPSAYGLTRAWAQSLYDDMPEIDGFVYESHQLSSDCIVLVQASPKTTQIFDRVGDACSVVEEPARSLLNAEARKVDAVVDFGDIP